MLSFDTTNILETLKRSPN